MVITRKISLHTQGHCDIIDITAQVEQQLTEADMDIGVVTVFVSGSTAGITTIELEPGLVCNECGNGLSPRIFLMTMTVAGGMVMDTHTFEPLCLVLRWWFPLMARG